MAAQWMKNYGTEFVKILKEELVPAMGCTEPISLALCAAMAKSELGRLPERAVITVSGNIVKNVKSVVVPHTGGMRGMKAAVAAGFVAGNPDKSLEVLSEVTAEQIEEMHAYQETAHMEVKQSETDEIFEIDITVYAGGHSARVRFAGGHTDITDIERDGQSRYHMDKVKNESEKADRSQLSIENIVKFAQNVEITDVKEILDRQIDYNTAIAREGLRGSYGAQIGKILLEDDGGVAAKAKAYAAAGSDARMNGCELPVVINSGSGNQGMTASLPVIVYAGELNVTEEQLYRALCISNLVTIHLKDGIGCLSAYCGATSAGAGAGAGITYLYGGGYKEIAHTIVNAIAINSGVVCDGAKASCAAKIASSVEAGLLGMRMYQHGSQFYAGDGIVKKGVEQTIHAVSELARNGMRETDREIIKLMLG